MNSDAIKRIHRCCTCHYKINTTFGARPEEKFDKSENCIYRLQLSFWKITAFIGLIVNGREGAERDPKSPRVIHQAPLTNS